MSKVLIVSMKAGAGHFKAAQAIEKAFKKNYPKIEIKNVDLFDYSSELTKNFYGKFHISLTSKLPEFYEWAYENISSESTDFRLLSDRLNARPFKKLINNYEPDLVIATHFVPANLASFWRFQQKWQYKLMITLTDYEAHKLWFDRNADLFTVATSDVKDEMVSFGADQGKIKVTGIPIDIKFSQHFNQNKVRRKLSLSDKFTVALFSGGFGMGPVEEIFDKLVKMPENIQLIAICGNNKDLFEKLQKKVNNRSKIFGFVENVEEIMAASDVIISKPGGLSVSESLAMGIPLIIINPIPGQEVANASYLTRNLAAFEASKINDILKILKKLYQDNELLSQVSKNAKKIAKPQASIKIAELAVKLMENK